ncbi:MAG TPA: CHAP domain-containing protein [Ktedonobacteraceae bacterium]|jgi:surface antigen|nr:CHAP domain-containing protein [Ktedonobacteraceae bacterium]
MSSFEDRQSSVTNELPLLGQGSQYPPVEQLPFPSSSPFTVRKTRLLDFTPPPATTGPLGASPSSPGVTGVLPEVQTGALPTPFPRSTTTSLRQPVVIRGDTKKSKPAHPPKARRWVISAAVAFLMLMITLGTAMAVSPAGNEGAHGFNPIQIVGNMFGSSSSNPSLVAQQAATATAITQQGGSYNPPSGGQYYGGGSGGPNRFAFGECTYWANMRYHALTGYWVPWSGDAWAWANGARAYGWVVSSTPKVPSIIVLQPGVQGAGYLGHVAIVESINKDGSVYTSNYNWYNGGGWDILSYYTFHPGPGVSFVWHS